MRHTCFPNNFSPALYLHRGSPWREDLQEKGNAFPVQSLVISVTWITTQQSHTGLFERADILSTSVMFVLPDDSCSRCGESYQRQQLIFYCDKMLALRKLNVTLTSSPPLQIWRGVVSFSKASASLSLCLHLSPALSISPPDVTCRSRWMKRDVQFPAPSPSEGKQEGQCTVFHIAT